MGKNHQPLRQYLCPVFTRTANPHPFAQIRLVTHLPSISVRRKILLPRPKSSSYDRPITAYLFFAPPEKELCKATELILEFPGGGFVAMSPEHHEERLRMWAVSTGRPVLAIDYGKAPECEHFATGMITADHCIWLRPIPIRSR